MSPFSVGIPEKDLFFGTEEEKKVWWFGKKGTIIFVADSAGIPSGKYPNTFHLPFNKYTVMKKLFLSLVLCLFALGVFAQQYDLSGNKIRNFQNKALDASFYRYSVFSIDIAPLVGVASADSRTLDFRINLEEYPALNTQLKPNPLFAESYFTTIATDKGPRTIHERPQVYPMINEAGSAEAALTVAADYLYGFFEAEGHTYFIEPLWYFDKSQPRHLFVVYDNGDIKNNIESVCGAIEIERQTDEMKSEERDGPGGTYYCGPPELEFAIANDYQMVTKFGSVDGVIAHNVATMNAVHANWDDDFYIPIEFAITTQWVPATQGQDPWPVTSDRDQIIQFFINWANGGGFGAVSYDLGHWRSPRYIVNPAGNQVLGATAVPAIGVPSVCTNIRYSIFSEYITLPACGLRTVTSHEMGHSFGATHTPTSGNIMYFAYQGCTDIWHSNSITEIDNGITGASCMTPSKCTGLPASVALPENLANICTPDEECYTFEGLPCVATFSASTNDPYLQITISGTTICLKSLAAAARISRVIVTPLDYCGNANQDPTQLQFVWNIQIDYPNQECFSLQEGDAEERRQVADTGAEGLILSHNNDFLNIEDRSAELRQKDIQVFDPAGRLLFNQQENGNFIQTPLNGLPTGVLVVRITAGDQMISKMITHF